MTTRPPTTGPGDALAADDVPTLIEEAYAENARIDAHVRALLVNAELNRRTDIHVAERGQRPARGASSTGRQCAGHPDGF